MKTQLTCEQLVRYKTGYTMRRCSRKPKWLLGSDASGWVPVCGLHAKCGPFSAPRQRKPLPGAKP